MVHFGDATNEPEENCATLDVFLTMLNFRAFLVRTANIFENIRSSCSFTHRTSPTFSIQYAPNEWHFMYVLNCTRRISFLECAFQNQYVHIKIKTSAWTEKMNVLPRCYYSIGFAVVGTGMNSRSWSCTSSKELHFLSQAHKYPIQRKRYAWLIGPYSCRDAELPERICCFQNAV